MPAILEPDEESVWLDDADPATHRSLLDPYPDSLLEAYPVSTAVNDPSNDAADLLSPVDVAEQSGLGEFGA
jgi:putative SOS response-associated peptidase YedK